MIVEWEEQGYTDLSFAGIRMVLSNTELPIISSKSQSDNQTNKCTLATENYFTSFLNPRKKDHNKRSNTKAMLQSFHIFRILTSY